MRADVATIGAAWDRRAGSTTKVAAVIGGAGFIGSHLCEALLARGRFVVCIDNFQRGSVHNLTSLVGKSRGVVVSHDATRRIPDDLPRFDEIYHLAHPSVGRSGSHVGPIRRTARLALRVMDRAARDGAPVLLAAPAGFDGTPSPAGAYGPWRDSDALPAGPAAGQELLFSRYAARRNVTLKVARIPDTYGPRMPADAGCEVADFVVRALRGEPISVREAGRIRWLCFVGDVVDGCVRLMETRADIPDMTPVAQPTAVSLAVLALTILELAGSASSLAGCSLPAGSAPRRSTAAGHANFLALGGTTLRAGLQLTLDDLASRLGLRVPFATCTGDAIRSGERTAALAALPG